MKNRPLMPVFFRLCQVAVRSQCTAGVSGVYILSWLRPAILAAYMAASACSSKVCAAEVLPVNKPKQHPAAPTKRY